MISILRATNRDVIVKLWKDMLSKRMVRDLSEIIYNFLLYKITPKSVPSFFYGTSFHTPFVVFLLYVSELCLSRQDQQGVESDWRRNIYNGKLNRAPSEIAYSVERAVLE